jgi:uncharacterized protein YciI
MMASPKSLDLIAAGEKPEAIGSLFIVEAESLEVVRRIMESDIYYKEKVVSNDSAELIQCKT